MTSRRKLPDIMVSRKPVPPAQSDSGEKIPPYPVSPTTEDKPAIESFVPPNHNSKLPYPTEDDTVNPWQDAPGPAEMKESWQAIEGQSGAEPQSIRRQATDTSSELPSHTPSGFRELTPQSSWERDSVSSSEELTKNPFASKAPQQAPPLPPSQAPPPPPVDTNPYRARSSERVPRVPVSKEEDSSNIWAELAQDTQPSIPQPAPVPVTDFDRLGLEDKPGWDSISAAPSKPALNPDSPLMEFDYAEDYKKELESTPFGPPDGLEDLDHDHTGKGKAKAMVIPTGSNEEVFPTPAGPPPAREPVKFSDRKITVPDEIANKQRSETYQIKHIRWADSNSHEIRTSPILIQNKNGPCPLMALVNALTLSTPSEANTALIETLRVREQISLGLLLDAVFDELMSGRRGNAAQGLPDVAELYAFLITLHTGMNVNPRFIPARRLEQSLMDGTYEEVPLSMDDYHKPGSFEDTKEMMLYGTFSVPLIHGWLPQRSHPAFPSIERSAATYEDAQNLMFREEELEDKVTSSGLNSTEQQLLEDITSIKHFLSSTATQLTSHGLQVINENLHPGSIAILFRNDHFSTLYKQPRSGQLLLLVTDAGYSSHDEIVWESLVDVSGEGSEFFSGDFRPVGGNPMQSQAFDQSGSGDSDWTTVQRGKGRDQQGGKSLPGSYDQPPGSSSGPNHEQEDADLALALQLQEEEEENSRRAAAQRRQDEAASTQYLAQNGAAPAPSTTSPATGQTRDSSLRQPSQVIQPLLPPRRNTAAANPRPAVHREQSTNNDDDAPPSYEAAAKAEPYLGPDISQTSLANSTGQASSSSSRPTPPGIRTGGRPRGQSAYSANNVQGGYPASPTTARRRSGIPSPLEPGVGVTRRTNNSSQQDRDKDCIIM